MLLGSETVTVQPKAQSVTDGIVTIANDGASYELTATVLPATGEQLEQLPELARLKKTWVMYVESPVSLGAVVPSPVITTSKGDCKIIGEDDYTVHTTGLPCKVYTLQEIEEEAGR